MGSWLSREKAYWRAGSKLDRKALGIDRDTVAIEYDLDAYSAAAKSCELARQAVRASLEHPDDHRAQFEANELKRHSRSIELANDYMQRQSETRARNASSESRRREGLQQVDYHQRRLEKQPFMLPAEGNQSVDRA